MSKLSQAIKKIANMNPEFVDFEPKEESNKGLEFLNMAEEILNDDHDEDCDYCTTPEQETEVNQFWEEKFAQDYMPKLKRAPTSEMQPVQMPELKSKPSHLEFPVMPKSKSKKEILDEVQSLLQELEDIESQE